MNRLAYKDYADVDIGRPLKYPETTCSVEMGDIWNLLDSWFGIKPRGGQSQTAKSKPAKQEVKSTSATPVKITIEVPSGSEVNIKNPDQTTETKTLTSEPPTKVEAPVQPTQEEKEAVMRDEMWASIRKGNTINPKTPTAKKVYASILAEQEKLK